MPNPTPPIAGPGAARCQQLENILNSDGRFGPYFGERVDVQMKTGAWSTTPKLCFDIANDALSKKIEVLQIKKADLVLYAVEFVRRTNPDAISNPPPVAAKKTTVKKVATPAATETPAPAVTEEKVVTAPVVVEAPAVVDAPAPTPAPVVEAPAPETPAPAVAPKPKRKPNIKTPVEVPQASAAEVKVSPVAAATTPPPAPAAPVTPAAPAVAAPVVATIAAAKGEQKIVDKVDMNIAVFSLLCGATIVAERDTTPGANERRVKLAELHEVYRKVVSGT